MSNCLLQSLCGLPHDILSQDLNATVAGPPKVKDIMDEAKHLQLESMVR